MAAVGGIVIFFSGIATGQLSMFQWMAPHPCPCGNTWLNSGSHATKQKDMIMGELIEEKGIDGGGCAIKEE